MNVSIIVPVLNEEKLLADFLDHLSCYQLEGHEVIVVDGGSNDNTVLLAEKKADKVLTSKPGRAIQMNIGAEAANNEILLFLHVDTCLPENALSLIVKKLCKKKWGRFDVKLSGNHFMFRIIETMMNIRSRLTGIATGDQAIFVLKKAFFEAGAYPDIKLMEDIALCKLLRKDNKPVCLPQKVKTSTRRWSEKGILKTMLLMFRLRILYVLGVNPSRLVSLYYATHDRKKYKYSDAAVLVFAKSPIPGIVKTRLIPHLGADKAAELQVNMIHSRLDDLYSKNLCAIQLWCTSLKNNVFFKNCANKYKTTLHEQVGEHLGDRMAYAIQVALKQYQRVVLVGCDAPALSCSVIEEALLHLDQANHVVLTPAEDGGYVLIAMKQYYNVFEDVDWGTDRVLQKTRDNISTLGLLHVETKTCWDVDDKKDYERLLRDKDLRFLTLSSFGSK